ncbi:hypothetical protein A2U01_0028910, partial [Trifolium medium]|nr:hypothetical protein [Trifolium medium]
GNYKSFHISRTTTHTELPHSTPSSPISPTPSLSHVPSADASGDDPHVDSPPQIGSKDPSDGCIWIRPGPTKIFDPCVKPTLEIMKIIKRKFEGSWATYGDIKGKKKDKDKNDKDVAELWFGEFTV